MQTCLEGLQMLRIEDAARHLCKDDRGMTTISKDERLKKKTLRAGTDTPLRYLNGAFSLGKGN